MSSLQLPLFQIQEIIHCKRRNSTIKTENKSCCVLSCRINGESLFFDSSGQHPVRRGDVLYIPIGASYIQECISEEIIGFHLTVSGTVSDRIEIRTCVDPDRICALFLRAHTLWSQKPPNYTYMCMAILYEILALSSAGLCSDRPAPDDVLTPAMEYLQAHLYDPDLSLQETCAHAHISRTYFNRLFSTHYHCTPISWITSRRIERAGQLLLTGAYTNAEIAALCGYRDVKYFYVRFREITGMTTGEYKACGGSLPSHITRCTIDRTD